MHRRFECIGYSLQPYAGPGKLVGKTEGASLMRLLLFLQLRMSSQVAPPCCGSPTVQSLLQSQLFRAEQRAFLNGNTSFAMVETCRVLRWQGHAISTCSRGMVLLPASLWSPGNPKGEARRKLLSGCGTAAPQPRLASSERRCRRMSPRPGR